MVGQACAAAVINGRPRVSSVPTRTYGKKTRMANLTGEQYNGLPFAFLQVQKGTSLNLSEFVDGCD
jgi:hypothetical protein